MQNFQQFQKTHPVDPNFNAKGWFDGVFEEISKIKTVKSTDIDPNSISIPSTETSSWSFKDIGTNGKFIFGTMITIAGAAAQAEAIDQGKKIAGEYIGELFKEAHNCEKGGMRRFKDIVDKDKKLASECAADCASKTNAECASIDEDAFNSLKDDIKLSSKFYVACLKTNPITSQCSWINGDIFSKIVTSNAELAGKIAEECSSLNNPGCAKLDISAFTLLVEKDPSEALIFAQSCASKLTPQCSTIGKKALDALVLKSASKAAALQKKCEELLTPQCKEINSK